MDFLPINVRLKSGVDGLDEARGEECQYYYRGTKYMYLGNYHRFGVVV